MEAFAEELGDGFNQFKIRTQINNERKKFESRTNSRILKFTTE